MKRWRVTLPVAGSLSFVVEANTAREAIAKGLNGDVDIESDDTQLEWETYRVISEGNVCYASVNRASAEEEEEES